MALLCQRYLCYSFTTLSMSYVLGVLRSVLQGSLSHR